MEKEINIKVKINSDFEIETTVNSDNWNNASTESKNIFIKERVKEYLLNQIDDIVGDLINDSKIEF